MEIGRTELRVLSVFPTLARCIFAQPSTILADSIFFIFLDYSKNSTRETLNRRNSTAIVTGK